MARTAVVAGTATAVSNRVSRRQAERWAADEQSTQSQMPEESETDYQIAQLEKLAELKNQGILTEQEFEAKKKAILG